MVEKLVSTKETGPCMGGGHTICIIGGASFEVLDVMTLRVTLKKGDLDTPRLEEIVICYITLLLLLLLLQYYYYYDIL